MNYFPPSDPEEERRRIFAKIYALLIKLAEEENHFADINKMVEEEPELLKSNIPSEV